MNATTKKITRLVFIVYIIGVLSLTFIVRETMILRTPDNRGVILEPFREIDAMLHQPNHFFWFMQIFLNILLFIPFGFLLPIISERFRSLWLTTLTGFIFSAWIETMQYITGRGLTEVDDVINNTAGALVGYILYVGVMWLYKRTKMNNYY
ncbi:MAG: VanZ family protein [Ruminococcus sp.]|nr:VanZ family protein [Ruminococcus sp.]